MSMRVGDRIVAPIRGDPALALSNIDRPEQIDRDYVVEVYHAAPTYSIDASIVLSQWHVETNGGIDPRWTVHGNPAGLLIEKPGDPDPAVWTGAEAAHVHIWALAHACDPTIGPDWSFLPGSAAYFVSRWTAKYHDANCPPVATIDDLNRHYTDATGEPQATWAWDAEYQDLIVERSRVLYGDTLPDQEGNPPVPTYSTVVPGLPGGPLLTDYLIVEKLIPESGTRQRPGITAHTPRRSVQHGTGNPNNPSAIAEAAYFVNGAEGRQASVHYCTDDHIAVVVVPLDEVTWQAADGSGPGNMNGFSCEMMEADAIWNDPARRDRLIAITADLMGRTAARAGAFKPEQHWDFNYNNDPDERHDCPDKLRHVVMPDGRMAWFHYEDHWHAARHDELARMSGTPTTTTTAPPPLPPPLVKRTPIPMPADAELGHLFWVGKRLYQVVAPERVNLARGARQYALPDGKSIASNTPLAKGKTLSLPYVVAGSDGLLYRASKAGTHIRAENLIPRRTTAEGG